MELYESDPDLIDDSDLEEQHLCNMYNFAAEQFEKDQEYLNLEKEK